MAVSARMAASMAKQGMTSSSSSSSSSSSAPANQYTPQQVAQINAARASNVASGVNAYSGSGATSYSIAQGLGSNQTPLFTPESMTSAGQPQLPSKPTPSQTGANAMLNIGAQLAAVQQQLADAQSAGYASTDTIQYDPKTGNIMPKAGSDAAGKKTLDDYLGKIEGPVNQADIYKEERKNAGIDQKQALVNQFTNQLNAISAKAAADKLSLVGQGRGVPEVIIGGQQAQIDREAAIQSLPVSAQLAAAQGDLALAQDHLDTYFKLRVEDAQNMVNYKNKLVDVVYEFANKQEQRALDAKKEKDQQDFQMKLAIMNDVHSQANSILKRNPSAAAQLMKLDPNSATYASDAARIVGTVSPKDSGNGSGVSPDGLLQTAINSGMTAEEAALDVAGYYESVGIQIDTKTVNSWIEKSRGLKKIEAPAAATTASSTPITARGLGESIKNSPYTAALSPENLAQGWVTTIKGIGDFFGGLTSK